MVQQLQTGQDLEQFEQSQFAPVMDNIKGQIMMAYMEQHEKLAETLMLAINSLTVVEFPDAWPSLLPGLMQYSQEHPETTLRVLDLLAEITNKYSYMTRSDPLYHQIIIVCQKTHDYLLALTKLSLETLVANQNNYQNVKILETLMKLFYNLNYQDLPPEFEDNLNHWMAILNQVMQLPHHNEALFKCKGAALQAILLYASKYKEDVSETIKGFSQKIWTLCANAKPDNEYDDIVFNSLKYFKSLILWQEMREFFADNIGNLISNLILPNIKIDKSTTMLMEDDPEAFLNNYFRSPEIGSRRAAAEDLLRSLTRNYKNFQAFLQSQISTFDASNEQGLCLLLTLVTDSAPKAFRDIDGATQLYIDSNLITYCYQNFIKTKLTSMYEISCKGIPLQNSMSKTQIVVILRFLFYFRIFLPQNQLAIILKLFCAINTEDRGLKQLLILCVCAMVTIRHGNFLLLRNQNFFFNETNFPEVAQNVFNFIARNDQENPNLNQSLNRLFYYSVRALKNNCSEFYSNSIRPIIINMFQKTASYNFDSVLGLFEGIGYLTYYLCLKKQNSCSDLQTTMQNYFMKMIQSQSDILNFCFQILSIFLQTNPSNMNYYTNLYQSVISADNWRQENVTIMASYIQYITAYLTMNQQAIINDKTMFQTILFKLIEIQHFQLFYRFLRKVLQIVDMQNFMQTGYMEIAVKGTEMIFQKSVEGRKEGLNFIFDITFNYDVKVTVSCMNSVTHNFYEQAVLNNQDIIRSIRMFRYRKLMYGSVYNALVAGCFSCVESEAAILNLLIENTLGRLRNRDFNPQSKQAKDTAYQKLQILREIDPSENPINLDDESILVQSYAMCVKRNPQLPNLISQTNLDRINKLHERQKNR